MAALAALVGLAVIGLAACGAATGNPYQPPADWHDITPPTGEQITSYAISSDVPGLIVACIGDQTAHTSAAPMGPAHIWRTRDAGAHWQRLPTTHFYGGCRVALPAGGHGTVFAENYYSAQFISVSHDAGDTWQTLATSADLQAVFVLFSAGVYRDGQLYSLGAGVYRDGQLYSLGAIARGQAGSALPGSLFASTDDGRTWDTLDASADPLAGQGFFATGLTPDYRTPGAWYRLMAQAYQGFSSNAQGGAGSTSSSLPATVLEHSSDNGRTWTALGPIGPRGTLSYWLSPGAMPATTPSQPDRLCAGFYPMVSAGGLDGVHDVAVYGSDDGGVTWTGATVAPSSWAAQPVLAMDTRGNCYTAAWAGPACWTCDQLDQDSTTFWRLAPGSSASPQQIARVTDLRISTLGVADLPGEVAPRLLAVVYTPQPGIICRGDICPPEVPHPPHLIWQPAT
jgi:hypothetical protein